MREPTMSKAVCLDRHLVSCETSRAQARADGRQAEAVDRARGKHMASARATRPARPRRTRAARDRAAIARGRGGNSRDLTRGDPDAGAPGASLLDLPSGTDVRLVDVRVEFDVDFPPRRSLQGQKEVAMQYLLLIYEEENRFANLGKSEMDK